LPYAEDPPDLIIGADDILFLDLGPVFEDREADFGRTFVLGDDPQKCKLRDKVTLYVHPDSRLPMLSLDEKGRQRHWILEIHFVDRELQIGGFYEELLTL
jgi:hypothetical protein